MINYQKLNFAVNNLKAKLAVIKITAPKAIQELKEAGIEEIFGSDTESCIIYTISKANKQPLKSLIRFQPMPERITEENYRALIEENEIYRRAAEKFLLPIKFDLAIIAAELNLPELQNLCSDDDITDENLDKLEIIADYFKNF